MVKSEAFRFKAKLWTKLAGLALLGLFQGLGQRAYAQGTTEFNLTTTSLDPVAIAPGGTSSTSIQVDPVNGFTGTVTLGCQVTSTQPTTSTPVCTVSPTTVTPSATATATITSTTQTTTVGYSVTITGTGPTTTFSAPPLQLTVLAVTPQFTITVLNAVAPSSVPAGSGAEGTISVNPVNGYLTPTGGITLYCSSITPLVTIAPVCSFTYPGNANTLMLGANPESVTLTISTFGPVTTGAAAHPRVLYGLWVSLPLVGLISVSAFGGKRSRRALVLLGMLVVGASFLLLPACSSTTATSSTTPNGVTPANSYTFTIVGIDSNGVISSNAGTSTSATTVTLTVTEPPKP
jgi:hypothetical protein